MDISLKSALAFSSTAKLSQTTQPISMQSLSPEVKQTSVNISPAAIYHPSTEAVEATEPMESIETWIGRMQSPDFPAAAAAHKVATESLKSSFNEFKSALAHVFPELAEKKFGFTIDADGTLKSTNSAGELNAADVERLDMLLNASPALKAAASQYRDASIELVETDSPWGGSFLGGYNLTKDNFARTIDLGALFADKGTVTPAERLANTFSHQLWSKGEVATKETEIVMLAERAAAKSAASV